MYDCVLTEKGNPHNFVPPLILIRLISFCVNRCDRKDLVRCLPIVRGVVGGRPEEKEVELRYLQERVK